MAVLKKMFGSLTGGSSSSTQQATDKQLKQQNNKQRANCNQRWLKKSANYVPEHNNNNNSHRTAPKEKKRQILRRVSLESLDKKSTINDCKYSYKNDKRRNDDAFCHSKTNLTTCYSSSKQQTKATPNGRQNERTSSWSPASCALIIIFGLFAANTLMTCNVYGAIIATTGQLQHVAGQNDSWSPVNNTTTGTTTGNNNNDTNSNSSANTTAAAAADTNRRPLIDCSAIAVLLDKHKGSNNSELAKYQSDLSQCQQASTLSTPVHSNGNNDDHVGVNLTTTTTGPILVASPSTINEQQSTTIKSRDDQQQQQPQTATTVASSSGSSVTFASGNLIETTTTTSGNSNEQANTEAPEQGEPNNSDENKSEPEEDDSDNDNRLSSTVLASASEAADQLVARLRSRTDSDDSDSDNVENDQDSATTTTAIDDHQLSSTASTNSSTAQSDGTETSNSSSSSSAIDVRSVEDQPESIQYQPLTSEATADPRENNKQYRDALRTYDKWVSSASDIIELFARKLLPIIAEHGYEVDTRTMTGVLQIFNAIRALKPWALKLLDASAKITPGLLRGTQSDFGDYDECLSIVSDDDPSVRGQYCLADIEFPKPPRRTFVDDNGQQTMEPIELRRPLLDFNTTRFKDTIFIETANFFHMLNVDPIRVGLCVTNQVEPESLETVFNKVFDEFKVSIHFKGRCVVQNQHVEWTSYQKISFYIIKTMVILVIISTIMDIIFVKVSSKMMRDFFKLYDLLKYDKLMTSFSLIRNTKRLFKANKIRTLDALEQVSNKTSSTSSLEGISSASYSYLISSAASSSSSSSLTTKSQQQQQTLANSLNHSPNNGRLSDNLQINLKQQQANSCQNNQDDMIIYDVNPTISTVNCYATTKQQQMSRMLSPSASVSTAASHCIIDGSSASSDKHQREALVKKRITNDDMLCLHGIRVLTMIWMIINHTYLFGGFFVLWAYRRLIDVAEWPKSLPFQLVLNGWLTVETYFFLSSMIIVLTLLPMMEKYKQKVVKNIESSKAINNSKRTSSNFNYLTFILHRLVRLLPAYIGVVCLNFLWPLISSGPAWLVKGPSFIQEPCENYLWGNFLFINNWLWPEKMCMVHTWYLSADFQLYLIAPLIVYLLYKRPYIGHSVNLLVAIVACIVSGLVIYVNKLAPSTLINKLEFDSIKKQLHYSYFATYQHMSPYCMGIFVGYLLFKKPDITLPKRLTLTLWIVLPPLSFTTLLLTYLWNGAYDDLNMINPSPLVSSIYVALHRFIWTSLLAWIVFACITGRARFLNNLLSWPMFVPISRLSFSIYLVHLPVIMFRALNIRQTIEWTDTNMLWEASGNFTASVLVAYLINIMFESPFINLEKVLLGSEKKNKRKDSFEELEYSEDQSSNSEAPNCDDDFKLNGAKVVMEAHNNLQSLPILTGVDRSIAKLSTIHTDSDSSISLSKNKPYNRTSRKRHTVIGTGKSNSDTISLPVSDETTNLNEKPIRPLNLPRSGNYHTLSRINSERNGLASNNTLGSRGRKSLTMNESCYQLEGTIPRLSPFYGTGMMRARLRQDRHKPGRIVQNNRQQLQYSSDNFLREEDKYENRTLNSSSLYKNNQLSQNQPDLSYGLMIPRVNTSTLNRLGSRLEINYNKQRNAQDNQKKFSIVKNTKNTAEVGKASLVDTRDDSLTTQRTMLDVVPTYEISRSSILNSLSQQIAQPHPAMSVDSRFDFPEEDRNDSVTPTIMSNANDFENVAESSIDMVSTL